MRRFLSDLVVTNDGDDLVAVIKVKNLRGLSRDEAIELRHDLLEYGLPDQIPYFLLLSQEKGFLWQDGNKDTPDAPPTEEFSMSEVVARYNEGNTGKWLFSQVLEWVVLEWLFRLAIQSPEEVEGLEKTEEPERTLARSGFNKAINGAYVLMDQYI